MSSPARHPRCVAAVLGWLIVALVLGAPPARAQITVVPTFEVGTAPFGETVVSTEVAVASDGTMLFAWNAKTGTITRVSTRQLTATGVPSTPTRRQASEATLRMIRPFDGGYFLLYEDLAARLLRLDAAGAPIAPTVSFPGFPVAAQVAATMVPFGVATAYAFQGGIFVQVFDYAGQPIENRVQTNDAVGAGSVDVAPLANGGFVVAWLNAGSRFRLFTGTGIPYSPIITVGDRYDAAATVAGNPQDGFTIVGYRLESQATVRSIMAWRYASDATFLGASELATLPVAITPTFDVAVDAAGNALAVWTENDQTPYALNPPRQRGRGMDANGVPLSVPFVLGEGPSDRIETALRPDGTFVSAWTTGDKAYGTVTRLCTAAVAVCGDGVSVPQCEACDDGNANSDTTPDVCRSDCTLPRCGDGVADTAYGEECDDGNAESCDGCTRDCRIEHDTGCGDGLIVPGCGPDQCDDGNLVDGDGCTATCRLERVPGGGGASSDCVSEWSVDNVANQPRFDAKGAFNALQVCIDGDPRCDFDGGVAGSCTFRVRVCANNTDRERCLAPSRLSSWELVRPSAAQAAKRPELAAARAAFAPVAAAIVGPDARDLCSDWLAVPLPLRVAAGSYRAAKLTLGSVARTYDQRKDADTLKLLCLPAES